MRHTFARPLSRHLQSGFMQEPQGLVGTHGVSQLLHENHYPPIAEAGILVQQLFHGRQEWSIAARDARRIAKRRSGNGEPRTRPALRQSASLRKHHLPVSGGSAYHFFGDFFHDLDLDVTFGREPFEPGILLLQLAHAFDVVGVHAAEMLPPAIDHLFADALALGDLGHRILVGLAQDADHLLFGKSSLSHGSLFVVGSHLLKFQMVRKGQSRSCSKSLANCSRYVLDDYDNRGTRSYVDILGGSPNPWP